MTLYLAMRRWEALSDEVIGVYSTRTLAQQACDNDDRLGDASIENWAVKECVLDAIIPGIA